MSLLPEYRAQLYDAAQHRAHRRVTRVARSWPIAVSTLVVVGVAVVAVATLSHRNASTPPAHSALASPTRELLDVLGVFRRPQTKADLQAVVPGFLRIAPGQCRTPSATPLECTMKVDRPLIRSVAIPGSGYTVGLFPVTARPQPSVGQELIGVAATLHGPGVFLTASAPPRFGGATAPWGLTAIRTRGLMLSAYVSNGTNRGAFVVPDGVARVVMGPVHLLDTKITSRFTPTDGATADVHDNVGLFQLNGLTEQNLKLRPDALGRYFTQGSGRGCQIDFAVYALPATAIVTWFGPDGRLVNHVRLNFPVYVGTHHPAPGTTRDPNCAPSR